MLVMTLYFVLIETVLVPGQNITLACLDGQIGVEV